MKAALNRAIDYCIEKDVLAEFLKKYRAEVLGMMLEEFDVRKYERSLREEGHEEGREEGDAKRLMKSVESVMKKLNIELPEACDAVGITVYEYQTAKERVK